jgi:hemoglobin
MKLIEGDADVSRLVRSFYDKVLQDELLSPFFQEAVKHNWDEHLRVMDFFWNNILFYTGGYYGNPLHKHQAIHQFKKLEHQHFERWLYLFNKTVDELFEGEKAQLAKSRAYSIATVMEMKVSPPEERQTDEPIY